MKKIIFFFIINFILSSCNKDDLTWNLARTSPNDAKLEVSEMIYSNNCSDTTGITLNAWGQSLGGSRYKWLLSNDGVTGNCIHAQKYDVSSAGTMDSATIEINTIIDRDIVLRFFVKDNIYGMPIDGLYNFDPNDGGKIKVNNKSMNVAIISKEYDENSDYYQAENWKKGWHQFQTEVIKKENNSIKIKFYKDVLIDNIELWVPIY
jgi:hypothetical protein